MIDQYYQWYSDYSAYISLLVMPVEYLHLIGGVTWVYVGQYFKCDSTVYMPLLMAKPECSNVVHL